MRVSTLVLSITAVGAIALSSTSLSAQEYGWGDSYGYNPGYNFANGSRQDRIRSFQNCWAAREAAEAGDFGRARVYAGRARLLGDRSRQRAYEARELGYGSYGYYGGGGQEW